MLLILSVDGNVCLRARLKHLWTTIFPSPRFHSIRTNRVQLFGFHHYFANWKFEMENYSFDSIESKYKEWPELCIGYSIWFWSVKNNKMIWGSKCPNEKGQLITFTVYTIHIWRMYRLCTLLEKKIWFIWAALSWEEQQQRYIMTFWSKMKWRDLVQSYFNYHSKCCKSKAIQKKFLLDANLKKKNAIPNLLKGRTSICLGRNNNRVHVQNMLACWTKNWPI